MQEGHANLRESDMMAPKGLGGGAIPGAGARVFAFETWADFPSAIPVLVAVPHAGRVYPDALLARMRQPDLGALRLEDRRVDALGHAMARASGAGLIVAHAPRAMIDLNRAESDVDWDMLGEAAPAVAPAPNARARGGLGLVPRRLPGFGEIWRGRITREELDARIEQVHRPYHSAVEQALARIRARWGAALLIDLHSMPPLPRVGGQAGAQIVLGDRFGASCHGALVASAFAHCATGGWGVAHNRPYAGGYGLDRHAAPRAGIHALQLEIDRAAYLDSQLCDLGEGFGVMAAMLVGLVERLGRDVARLGEGHMGREAAE
jgi:N-formylglutamate amidohydrolase